MPLTLEEYANYLDGRGAIWPAPPELEKPSARPHLKHLSGIKIVLWNAYGTLLAISGGELCFEADDLVMEVALEKTVSEFNMWGAMTRKPGQPGEYLGRIYRDELFKYRNRPGGTERYPETAAEDIWETILKKLLQKDYKFDTGFFGSLNEYSRKIAYFFHSSLQGTACYPEAARSLLWCREEGLIQGLLGNGQCFTAAQIQRGLNIQREGIKLDELIPPELRFLSHQLNARKPSERLFLHALSVLKDRGIAPEEVLHVGSRLQLDVAPARKLGMKTALFAGDKLSLKATQEELQARTSRPDALLTRLGQIASVLRIR
jgi:FMN phosphatase YigB (HAD superfamily)